MRLAWRMLGDEQAARDVSQDAFLAVAGSLGSLKDVARMEGWFYRTLVRRAHNHRRWRAVRERFTGPWREPRAADPEPGLRGRIDRAVATLSDGQRDAFVLVHVEGFTVDEAATLLGKAPGTVKSHLHRALTALRVELADLAGDADVR